MWLLEAVHGRHHSALPQDHIQRFHDDLNLIETTIQFTIETEVDGTLLFLDIRITWHTDGLLSTTVFRKETNTELNRQWQSM